MTIDIQQINADFPDEHKATQLVATEKGNVVGSALIQWIDNMPIIYNLMVDEEKRQNGIARQLMDECLDIIIDVNPVAARISCSANNKPMMKLVNEFGFKLYWKNGDRKKPVDWYIRHF